MKELSIFSAQKSTSFRILCRVLVRYTRISNQTVHGMTDWDGSQVHQKTILTNDGEPMDFEWNIFPGYNTLQLNEGDKSLLLKLSGTPENSQERSSSCRCSTTPLKDQETMKKNACQMPNSYLCTRGDLEKDTGHLLVLVLRKVVLYQ